MKKNMVCPLMDSCTHKPIWHRPKWERKNGIDVQVGIDDVFCGHCIKHTHNENCDTNGSKCPKCKEIK